MIFSALANSILVIHVAFVIFAVFGGLFVLYRRRWAWIHIPVVAWAALVEMAGWTCPLTPLENYFRYKGGHTPYDSDFIANYLLPVLYPAGLRRWHQVWLGLGVLAINLILYGWVLYRRNRREPEHEK